MPIRLYAFSAPQKNVPTGYGRPLGDSDSSAKRKTIGPKGQKSSLIGGKSLADWVGVLHFSGKGLSFFWWFFYLSSRTKLIKLKLQFFWWLFRQFLDLLMLKDTQWISVNPIQQLITFAPQAKTLAHASIEENEARNSRGRWWLKTTSFL